MPRVKANGITINYDRQGSGEPLVLIPFLTADCACYSFQVAEYAKYFDCISLDLRGTGETDDTIAPYTTEDLADDVAALMRALEIPAAHVSGLSLGAAVGMWLAAKYPEMVTSLSLHSGWPKSDAFLQTVIGSFQQMVKATGSVSEMVVQGLFTWCFTPELYVSKPEYIQALADFVRSRPPQSIDSFMAQSNAVIAHDVEAQLARIAAPTLITFGRQDVATSTRFANRLQNGIRNSELRIFEGCSHAPIYENVEEFNRSTLEFLTRQRERVPSAIAS